MTVFSIITKESKRQQPCVDSLDKIIIRPFLDGSLKIISLYRITNVLEKEAAQTVSDIFQCTKESLMTVPISTDGSMMSTIPDQSVLANYTTEEITLWFLPLSIDYDPRHLYQMLIPVKVPANTLIIHTEGSLGIIRSKTKMIRHAFSNNMSNYFNLIISMYEKVVPRIVKCNVIDIRPAYNDLGEWLLDSSNVYIGPMKSVFSSKQIDGKKDKFIRRDSIYWKFVNETDIEYRKRILSCGANLFYEAIKSKSLGCWCDPITCHGTMIIDEFRKLFLVKTYHF